MTYFAGGGKVVRTSSFRDARIVEAYLKSARRKAVLIAGLAGAVFVLAVFAVSQGTYEIGFFQVLQTLVSGPDGPEGVVVWNIRLPRIAAAIVSGWGLSMAGLSLQSLLKNPLASPATLGISQGAAFGAAFSVVAFKAPAVSSALFAFAGAMGATAAILLLARLRRMSPEALILAGVAFSSLFASGTILIQYLATEAELAVVVFWTFGDVVRSGWGEIGITAAAVFGAFAWAAVHRWDFTVLHAGQDTAQSLGVSVRSLRLKGMVAAALVSALVTSFHGVIAFMGLIAPHMARRLVGEDHRLLIPCASILGALLLLAADTLGRIWVGSGSLPVGVVTSFLGAPMFLYLLIRGYR